jgi:hypothetical protein
MSLIFLHDDVKGVGFFKVVYSTTYVLNAGCIRVFCTLITLLLFKSFAFSLVGNSKEYIML